VTNEELCKALRSALWGQGNHINIKAADRIEALVKERDKWRDCFNTNTAILGETEHRADLVDHAAKSLDEHTALAIREAALREAAELFGDSVTGRAVARCILALIDKKEG
jgi:hypothetical protein